MISNYINTHLIGVERVCVNNILIQHDIIVICSLHTLEITLKRRRNPVFIVLYSLITYNNYCNIYIFKKENWKQNRGNSCIHVTDLLLWCPYLITLTYLWLNEQASLHRVWDLNIVTMTIVTSWLSVLTELKPSVCSCLRAISIDASPSSETEGRVKLPVDTDRRPALCLTP